MSIVKCHLEQEGVTSNFEQSRNDSVEQVCSSLSEMIIAWLRLAVNGSGSG